MNQLHFITQSKLKVVHTLQNKLNRCCLKSGYLSNIFFHPNHASKYSKDSDKRFIICPRPTPDLQTPEFQMPTRVRLSTLPNYSAMETLQCHLQNLSGKVLLSNR